MTGFCPICKKDYKNLGAHIYQSHKDLSASEDLKLENEVSFETSDIEVDEVIKEKPLSILVSEIKDLLRPYQNEITIRIAEKGSRIREIEIVARIQL